MWLVQHSARRAPRVEAGPNLRHTAGILHRGPRPPAQDRPDAQPEREVVLDGNCDGGLGMRANLLGLAPVLMQPPGENFRIRHAERMVDLARDRQRAFRRDDRLVGVSAEPERERAPGVAGEARVGPVQHNVRPMRLRIVHCQRLVEVGARALELTGIDERRAECPVRLEQQSGVLRAFGDAEQLLADLARRAQLSLHDVEAIESVQHRKELRRIAEQPAQLPRPIVGLRDVRVRIASQGRERAGERDLKLQLPPLRLRVLRHGLQRGDAALGERARFLIGEHA